MNSISGEARPGLEEPASTAPVTVSAVRAFHPIRHGDGQQYRRCADRADHGGSGYTRPVSMAGAVACKLMPATAKRYKWRLGAIPSKYSVSRNPSRSAAHVNYNLRLAIRVQHAGDRRSEIRHHTRRTAIRVVRPSGDEILRALHTGYLRRGIARHRFPRHRGRKALQSGSRSMGQPG